MKKSVFVYNHGPHKSSLLLAEKFGIGVKYYLSSPSFGRPYSTVIWGILFHLRKLRSYDLFFLEGFQLVFLSPFLKKKSRIIIKGNDQVFFHIETKKSWKVFMTVFMRNIIPKSRVFVIAVSDKMALLYRKHFKLKVRVADGFLVREYEKLRVISPGYSSKNFIFIGKNSYFKGVDISVKVFEKLKRSGAVSPECRFFLIGGHREFLRKRGMKPAELEKNVGIVFVDETDNIEKYLEKSLFQLHLARFEPNAVALMEGMSAGLIPFVSESTGNSGFIENIDSRLVFAMSGHSEDNIASRMGTVLKAMSKEDINNLSQKIKEKAVHYSRENGLKRWGKAWRDFTKEE